MFFVYKLSGEDFKKNSCIKNQRIALVYLVYFF